MHARLCLRLLLGTVSALFASSGYARTPPLFHTLDLNIGETINTSLADDTPLTIRLLNVRETKGKVMEQRGRNQAI